MTTAPIDAAAGRSPRRSGALRFFMWVALLGILAAVGVTALRFVQERGALASAQAAENDPLSARLNALEARMDKSAAQDAALQQGLSEVQRKLDQVISALAAIGTDTSALRAQADKAPAVAAAKPVRRPAPRPARPIAAAPPEASRVLGVDTWNGEPVVAVKVGGQIEFARPGDKVGDAMLERADAHGQTAVFRRREAKGSTGAASATGAQLSALPQESAQ
ncbi:hypothetical protein OPU71_18395 [Niveibacterium sp. 24ML]|uniref:hypothetical protein n=1 Tax=Niveibacterium sp. 24ML TaxID=2985512 RepID=UPI00226D9C23|nr:hypothetical protein [Niveibacterium sp. 24ML]MCX9158096.1 hypothetical protein [Niveibacterium sp. 24ML]